jgi:uncharacterized protein YbjT (DUF2867 family)
MILITGASGNVGSEVLKQAAAAGLKIRAPFQSPVKASKAQTGVEAVITDYAKPETIRPALKDVEKVFLVGPPARNLPALEGNFVKEVRAAGRTHVVKLSALGGRASLFPSGHRDSEENIEASGLPYTFLRPNGFMQNFVNYSGDTIRTQNAFYGCQGERGQSDRPARRCDGGGQSVSRNRT